jgi:asparagine synthase (glutamine-hydrolysing)
MTPLPEPMSTPRAAFEAMILAAVDRGPCFVAFSGGRDSSAVLAVATRLARREGLPDPVPVTELYPGVDTTDESAWQRLVIDHLGLSEWVRLPHHGESDLLGEAAQASLLRRGLLSLPAFHTKDRLFATAAGGTMLTGEGGDEVMGPRRITPLTLMIRMRRPLSRRLLTAAASAALPAPVRRASLRSELRRTGDRAWLRPAAAREHHRLLASDEAAQPLRWDVATWWLKHRRAVGVALRDYAAIAAEQDVRLGHPFLDDAFLAALARAGGRWGYAGRTALMRTLFADVLPDELLRRSGKASFDRAYMGAATREFARSWDGAGVNPALVDPDVLRAAWTSDTPSTLNGLLLQSAWLASRSSTVTVARPTSGNSVSARQVMNRAMRTAQLPVLISYGA